MWKIRNEEGLVVVDKRTKMRPIDTNDAVIGIVTIEEVVALFESEADALARIAELNLVGLVGLVAVEQLG